MNKTVLKNISSSAIPMHARNIDTDQIIPARFLRISTRGNFGDYLFRDLRFDMDGKPIDNFVLHNPLYNGEILVAGHNFGSGSSREHAVWALSDYGFTAVISSFFADIFKNNALNNRLLPVQVSESFLQKLLKNIEKKPDLQINIDIEKQTISVPEIKSQEKFYLDPYKKLCLLEGYDDIDYLLSNIDSIEKFEITRTEDYSI
jgi:3-isopropylmalate/(R)-2-methylmalate dehydratase small subunit